MYINLLNVGITHGNTQMKYFFLFIYQLFVF
jgi:hypothetical protein